MATESEQQQQRFLAPDYGSDGPPDLVPRPDPTKLTIDAITAFSKQVDDRLYALRTEQGLYRDILTQRLDAMDEATRLRLTGMNDIPEQINIRVSSLQSLLEARLEAMLEADALRLDSIRDVPEQTRKQLAHLEQLHDEKFGSTESVMEEKFSAVRDVMNERLASVQQQFKERDIRTGQAATASDQALQAALQAAKELVSAQSDAFAAAAVKSETSFTKQIDQIATLISSMDKNWADRLNELKERVDRGEGDRTGVGATRIDQRASFNTALVSAGLFLAAILGIVSIVITLVKK